MGTRWFIGEKSAEGDAYFPVELSEVELDAVNKFIAAQANSIGQPYCGGFGLLEDGVNFGTKEEAEQFIREFYY